MTVGRFGKVRIPAERVTVIDLWTAIHNREKLLSEGKMVYFLACGHREIGRLGSRRLHCSSCQRIWDLGLDYHAFRHLGAPDPLRDLDDGG